MAELTSLQAAAQIDRTVREIMFEVMVPSIQKQVQENIVNAVYIAISNIPSRELTVAIEKVLRERINNKIHISITVDD